METNLYIERAGELSIDDTGGNECGEAPSLVDNEALQRDAVVAKSEGAAEVQYTFENASNPWSKKFVPVRLLLRKPTARDGAYTFLYCICVQQLLTLVKMIMAKPGRVKNAAILSSTIEISKDPY